MRESTFRPLPVVLTAGTFLGGRIHIGLRSKSGGRAGEASSLALAARLREMPFRVGRLKTGTPLGWMGTRWTLAKWRNSPETFPSQ